MDICLCEGLQMVLFYNMMDAKMPTLTSYETAKINKSTKKLEEKNLKKKNLKKTIL